MYRLGKAILHIVYKKGMLLYCQLCMGGRGGYVDFVHVEWVGSKVNLCMVYG